MFFGRWRFLTNADNYFFGIFGFTIINNFADYGFIFFYFNFIVFNYCLLIHL